MNIELKNDLLNLPQLQSQVDTIVFDYIDSKPNWSKAYEQLNTLLQKCAQNFNGYIARNNGALPKASTYWVLYMDIVAKLLYFTGLAKSHLIAIEDQEATAQIIELYKTSASCLPNASLEDNEEFISEVQKSLDKLAGRKLELLTSEKTDTCIEKFYALSKTME
ncbi:GTPase [Solibacillus daqui]|uniref:GTPase n=1 Tax=Solibacillus daqui TaxID=2912187 RepID=UPI0023662674|nr:GTPase [Solibacillus daqui]